MGVEHVWLIDPVRRRGHVVTRVGLDEPAQGEFVVSGTSIRLHLAEVFAELDGMLSEV